MLFCCLFFPTCRTNVDVWFSLLLLHYAFVFLPDCVCQQKGRSLFMTIKLVKGNWTRKHCTKSLFPVLFRKLILILSGTSSSAQCCAPAGMCVTPQGGGGAAQQHGSCRNFQTSADPPSVGICAVALLFWCLWRGSFGTCNILNTRDT